MLTINAQIHLKGDNLATVVADSPEELHRALTYFATIGVLPGLDAAQQAEPPVHPDGVPVQTVTDEQAAATLAADKAATQDAPAPKPEKPTRTRKPKEEKAEPAKESASADTGEKSASGDKPKATAEEAAAAITNVANKLGLPAARNMLDIFKVKRVGELDPSQYASFIKECGDLTSGIGGAPDEDANELL